MERPDIPALMALSPIKDCGIQLDDVVYYVAHATILREEGGKGMPRWFEGIFAAMERNALHVTDYYRLPRNGVVEIGRQFAI
jgi:KUP system potassium uptake protein